MQDASQKGCGLLLSCFCVSAFGTLFFFGMWGGTRKADLKTVRWTVFPPWESPINARRIPKGMWIAFILLLRECLRHSLLFWYVGRDSKGGSENSPVDCFPAVGESHKCKTHPKRMRQANMIVHCLIPLAIYAILKYVISNGGTQL